MGKPRIVSTLLIGFILIAVFLPSCEKYDRHISEILDRLDKIEGTSLATIDQQITAINASLEDLKTVDAALEKLIDDLEAETADLQQQLDDNATADAATKKALKDEIAAIKLLIAALQAKDAELEQRYFDLEQYINDEIAYTEEWANFTFATLQQYDAMQTEIAGIKALIEQYKTDVTAEYTDAIKTAITACETSMKEWVNGVLADGYYTKAELDGKITAFETQVTEGDTALQKEIDELKASLAKAESDLTAAYKKAIEDAIETNNGVINEAIASAVEAAQNALQSKIDAINNRINTLEDELDELKNNFANRIQSLEYIPIYSDGEMGFDYATRSVKLYFRISPASIAMLIKSGNVTAFARETENPNTRAINPEVQLGVAEVNGDKTGVIEVKIVESGESTFSTKFWEGENEAVIYIKITDDNGNDITSDMVPIVATGYVAYLGDITDAAMAKTGDVALTDGSFVSNAKIAEMTEAQKAAMAGIVFWTVADTDPTGRTYPASLTEDKVMNADFPHCTHGLIVSFKNISTGCVWQGIRSNNETNNIESIYSNFQNTDAFNPTNKDEYTAIGTNVTEENINKILGYNNTKVLEAYNAYCETNNRSDFTVNPISVLVAWRKSNPAPANSTGWYLPSAKELHMLCYKDVDNIRAGGNGYTNTKEVVNASLVKFNGSTFGDEIYASSTEYYKDYGYYHVFTVTFKNASVYHNPKYNDFFVRAVCAF